jgi:hypothetical protein
MVGGGERSGESVLPHLVESTARDFLAYIRFLAGEQLSRWT